MPQASSIMFWKLDDDALGELLLVRAILLEHYILPEVVVLI